MTRPTRISDGNGNLLPDKEARLILAIRQQPPDVKQAIERMIDRIHDGMDADSASRLFEQEIGQKVKR